MPNLPPNDAQRSALDKLVAQQESMMATLEQLHEENTIEYKRLDQNAQILRNMVDSTKILRDIGTQIQNQISPLFLQLDNELLSQEANYPVLSLLLSSTRLSSKSGIWSKTRSQLSSRFSGDHWNM